MFVMIWMIVTSVHILSQKGIVKNIYLIFWDSTVEFIIQIQTHRI